MHKPKINNQTKNKQISPLPIRYLKGNINILPGILLISFLKIKKKFLYYLTLKKATKFCKINALGFTRKPFCACTVTSTKQIIFFKEF